MAVEIKTHPSQAKSMSERLDRRLRPSNDSQKADMMKQQGQGSTRVVTSLHHSGQNRPHRGSGGDYRE